MRRSTVLDGVLGLGLLLALIFRHQPILMACILGAMIGCWYKWRWDIRTERVLIVFLLTVTIGASLLAPFDPMVRLDQGDILGLDSLNRDRFSRLLLGNRNSISIASVGSVLAVCLGTCIGAMLALGPKWLQKIMHILLQSWLSIPAIVYFYLGLALAEKGGAFTLMALFGLTLWPESARLLEARITELENADFVHAARMGGKSELSIFVLEILPNLRSVWTVNLLVTFISAVLLESAVGFLGLGLSVGTPSLGHLIEIGARQMDRQPWMLIIPITILMVWIYTMRAFLKRLGTSNPALLVP